MKAVLTKFPILSDMVEGRYAVEASLEQLFMIHRPLREAIASAFPSDSIPRVSFHENGSFSGSIGTINEIEKHMHWPGVTIPVCLKIKLPEEITGKYLFHLVEERNEIRLVISFDKTIELTWISPGPIKTHKRNIQSLYYAVFINKDDFTGVESERLQAFMDCDQSDLDIVRILVESDI